MTGRCVHHWQIAEPHGTPTVEGVCKKCGVTREFYAAEIPAFGDFSIERPAARYRHGDIPW